MRILHISLGWPPFRSGGLVRYCCDLMDEQARQGHTVGMLYPAGNSYRGHGHVSISQHGNITSYALYTRNLVPLVFGVADPESLDCSNDERAHQKILDDFKPEVIHVHSIQGIGEGFFHLAKERGIRMVFTTHDYYPLCLRCNLMDVAGSLCSGPSPEKCARCNMASGLSVRKGMLMQSTGYRWLKGSRFIRRARTRVKASVTAGNGFAKVETEDVQAFSGVLRSHRRVIEMIDVIHANSNLAKRIYRTVFPSAEYRVLPVTHAGLEFRKARKIIHSPLRIGYVGGANEYKGYRVLLDALSTLDIPWHLDFYGTPLNEDQLKDERIVCHGFYDHDEFARIFSSIDILVVPSIWPETFGFAVLEAICSGAPVICSDLVGAGSILPGCFTFPNANAFELHSMIEKIVKEGSLEERNAWGYTADLAEHVKDIESIYER